MHRDKMPLQGEIYIHFKGNPYQIVAIATHSETGESMVVYQALYGDYKTYVRELSMFISEVDKEKYPEVKQRYRFELKTNKNDVLEGVSSTVETSEDQRKPLREINPSVKSEPIQHSTPVSPLSDKTEPTEDSTSEGTVNTILLEFLDASSYTHKLEVITCNIKHLDNRLINDMAVSLDCAVNEGPIENRIQELIHCLKAMCRFEDRRHR